MRLFCALEALRPMPPFHFPDGAVVIIPALGRAWVSIVRDNGAYRGTVAALNADELLDEAAAFLRSFGITDLDGSPIRMCPPELAAKAIFPRANRR
jgi:hypothetical protein